MVDRLADALELMPEGRAAVVFHTAVQPYAPRGGRIDRFAAGRGTIGR
ncbi:MAG: hypothetical protein JWO98_3390 [Frankiales bacterium]|nr:hypothetical protein [Frankiales bacterium]